MLVCHYLVEILQALVGRVPFLSNTFSDSHSEIEAVIRDPNFTFQSVIAFPALLTAGRRNRGANHSKKISYTFCENPIVLSGNPQKSFCFRENLVRYLQE